MLDSRRRRTNGRRAIDSAGLAYGVVRVARARHGIWERKRPHSIMRSTCSIDRIGNGQPDNKGRPMNLRICVRQIIHTFFLQPGCEQLLLALECVDEDCVLGGLGEKGFYKGKEDITAMLFAQKKRMEKFPFSLVDEWYESVPTDSTWAMVYGRAHVRSGQIGQTHAPDEVLDIEMCISALFQKKDVWRLTFFHLSVPYSEGELSDYFSGTLSRRFREAQSMLCHMRQLVEQDPVTLLYNHRAFFNIAEQRARHENCYLMVLDLDHFKYINDTYGHLIGDEILKRTGAVLCAATRKNDVVGRVGGDEFAILCTDVQTDEAAMSIAERIVDEVNHLTVEPLTLTVKISVGVAKHRAQNTLRETFKQADVAMYQV